VVLGVTLRGFSRMVSCVQVVSMREVGMMPCLFMVPGGVVLGRFFVMTGGMFMMLGRFCMMFCACFAHKGVLRGEVQWTPIPAVFIFNTLNDCPRTKKFVRIVSSVNNS
jgi:hypothetical protein